MTQELINKIKHFIKNNQLLESEQIIDSNQEKNAELLYLSGIIKYKLNKNEEALKYLKEIKEENPQVFLLMANINEKLSKLNEALECLDKAIKINQSFWQAHFNKGVIMIQKKEFKEAEKLFKKVLKIDSNNYDAEYYLGIIAANYDFKIAEKHYRKSISLNYKNKKAHAELGKILLFYGNLKDGWKEYEWGLNYLEKIYPDNIKNIPIWDGKDSNKHRILIFREQGLGDEILYASCYNEIINKTNKCFFISENRLINLFKNSFPKGEFLSEDDFSKNTDLSKINPTTRIQSTLLPKFLRKTFKDFPKQKKYLIPNKEKFDIWREKLKESKGKLKVGIAWSSSAFNSKKNNILNIQSPIEFKLSEWEHFLSINNIYLINLMYKNVKEEINSFNIKNKNKILNYENLDIKNDIDNLAALIANLDVVISAQTWVGDFAAALGVEVFKFHNPLSLTRLGQRNIPWNNSTIFDIKNNSWKDSFELIKSLLNKRIVK